MVHHWSHGAWASVPAIEPITVALYLAPGFELLAVSLALDVFRLTNKAAGREAFRWRVVSHLGGAVRASCGIDVTADADLARERRYLMQPERPVLALVFGDEHDEGRETKALSAWLRECRQRRIAAGAFGNGVTALAKAGLLNDRKCAVHWEAFPGFKERFMRIEAVATIYEADNNIWSCAGGTAAFDMMIELVKHHCGEPVAVSVAELAVAGRIRTGQERQRLPLLRQHGRLNPTVVKLIELMQRNLAAPLTMADLAAAAGLSRRQVERLFRNDIGRSPCRYFRELRLEHAKLLLAQSAMPVLEIAVSCGFVSASHFSRCFREAHLIAPHEARNLPAGGFLSVSGSRPGRHVL
ncbi:GlxA family transcriptional regulator [Mesorhizobium sp. YC-39]|uniref:GlxA family transcriptional regulator n=1 Tax=unclassified Mesorhizobium TaxID=325217 RepID=UPI0021E7E171|nr:MULTISPECIES: GlxA family transcriptional regulator [unclassified Mesorhizobium]MCV3211708.1 GlxA family transcriptional regulator [Mesorhizobium sp. YC-2]MCV3233388.1 GlxA family transcriptional regulator [Mesorhizobium sp. YC-39]